MVPSAATTGPGVMLPPSERVHFTVPCVGPEVEEVAVWELSWSALGHGDWPSVAADDALTENASAPRIIEATTPMPIAILPTGGHVVDLIMQSAWRMSEREYP
jgi:hypothetical protein